MCKPKSEGGRRCAAHHHGTLAMKFIVKNTTRLEDGQVDYSLKTLRRTGHNSEPPTVEEYHAFLNSEKEAVLSSDIGETIKNRMIGKIDKALEDDQLPTGPAFYSMKHAREQGKKTWRTLATKLRTQSEATGMTPSKTLRTFREMYSNTVTPRGSEVDYTSALDPKTLQVFSNMQSNFEPKFEETPRITREGTGKRTLVSQGYDPEDGRLEVEHANGRVYAFHSVSPEDYEKFKANPVAMFNNLRVSSDHQYENKQEEEKDAYRVFCEACNEYKIATGHACEDGQTSGRILTTRKSPDDAYKKIKDHYLSAQGVTQEAPLATPNWTVPLEEREAVEFNGDYIDYDGHSGRNDTSTSARRIQADMNALRQHIASGETVEVLVGRKIPVAGTNQTEFHEIMVPARVGAERGNLKVNVSPDYTRIKCTCDVYQRNGRCTHTHPTEGSDRINRFVEADVNESVREMMDSFVLSRSEAFSEMIWDSNIYAIKTTGEAAEGSTKRDLSDSDLEQIRYIATHFPNARIGIVPGTTTGEFNNHSAETYWTSVAPDGTASVATDWRTGDNDYAHRQNNAIKADLRSTNFVAARLAANAQEMFSGWEVESESRTEYLARFNQENYEPGYMQNPDEFIADYMAASAVADEPIEFVAGSVTGGYLSTSGDEPGARGFGIEIEFSDANRNQIARALHSAGLTNSGNVAYYHQENDYTSWRVEEDCSVSGEIVSPILYDNAEDWDKVRKICEIAKQHGARASVQTGQHVHIGTRGMSEDHKRGVFAATAAHQDVIRRVATDPARKTHRTTEGNSYSAPFTEGDMNNVYSSRSSTSYLDRYRIANFQGNNTIEFRDPDGTLDPGHIQANVMLAAALTAAGERGSWNGLTTSTARRQKVGANAAREVMINNSDADENDKILSSNISLMVSLDSLFPDKESRKKILTAAVKNPWQPAPRSHY